MSAINEEARTTRQVGVRCDACGRTERYPLTLGWAHFSSGHEDWAVDSPDSIEHHDACSAACWRQIVIGLMAPGPRTIRARLAGRPSAYIGEIPASMAMEIAVAMGEVTG